MRLIDSLKLSSRCNKFEPDMRETCHYILYVLLWEVLVKFFAGYLNSRDF